MRLVAVSAFIALSACATHEPGWHGSGAEPFDQALAACHAQVDVIADQAQRETALETCMGQKGWTRR